MSCDSRSPCGCRRRVLAQKFSCSILASAIGVVLATPGYAANNIEIVSGGTNVNINGSTPFVSSADSAQLGADLLTGATGGFTLSTGTGGGSLQDGDITFNTAIDYNGLGQSSGGSDGAWYGQTLTLNAHDDIIFNNDFYDSDNWGIFEDFRLILNPDSDNSGAGAVYIGANVTGTWYPDDGLSDTLVTGDMFVLTGGSFTGGFTGYGSLEVNGDLTIEAGATVESHNLTAGSISLQSGGVLDTFDLTLTNSDIAIDSTGLLGADVSMMSLSVQNQTVGTGDAASGTYTNTMVNEIAGALTINSGGVYNLNAGALRTGSIVNNGEFNFNGGLLHLTNQDLNVDSTGLLGDTVVDRNIHVVNQTVGTAVAGSGTVTLSEGFYNTVDGALTINAGGAVNLNGGSVSAGTIGGTGALNFTSGALEITSGGLAVGSTELIGDTLTLNANDSVTLGGGLAVNADGTVNLDGGTLIAGTASRVGTFNFTAGSLQLTNGGFAVEAAGLFGDTLTLNGQQLEAVSASVGTATAASGSVTHTGGSLVVNDTLTMNSGGSYTLDGGTLEAGSIVNNGGSVDFVSGALQLNTGALNVGSSGGLGDNVSIADGSSITMAADQTVTVDAGGTLTLDGGTLKTGAVVNNGSFGFNSGVLRMTASDITVGTGGLLGDTLTMSTGKRLYFDNGHQLIVDASGTLVLDGGLLAADSVVNNGTFQFLSGSLSFYGGTTMGGAGALLSGVQSLGMGASLVVGGTGLTINAGNTLTLDGGYLSANQITNGGTFNFNSGELRLRQDLTIGAGGTLNNDVVIGADSEIWLGTTGYYDAIINSGASLVLDGGILTAKDVVNNGSFQFISGILNLRNGLTVGAGGLLGDNISLGADQRYSQYGGIVVEAGASLSIDGGVLHTDEITNNGGTVALNSGELYYGRALTVGATGALGDNVTIGAGATLNFHNSGYINDDVQIDAGASLVVDGGTLRSGQITNNGTFAFNSGAFTYNSDLTVGSSGLLGDDVVLNNNRTLSVQKGAYDGGNVTVEAGASLRSQGGSHSAAQLFNSGTVAVAGGEMHVSSTVTNDGRVTIGTNGAMILSDSSSVADDGFIQTAGRTRVDGKLQAKDVYLQGGTLMGDGQIHANLAMAGGVVSPGNSPGSLEVTGDFSMTGGQVSFEVASDGAGGYLWDQIIVGGAYDLQSGTVKISLLDGWGISDLTNDFTIGDFFRQGDFLSGGALLSDNPFDTASLGMFGGLTLLAYDVTGDSWFSLGLDGSGGFLATPTTAPVPVPAAVWLFGSGLLGLVGMARRKAA